MVAWWLRVVSVFNVLCVMAWCAWAWPRSPWLAVAGVAFALMAGRLWLGMEFLAMLAFKRRMRLGRPGLDAVMHAWSAETHVSARCFAWLMPWREWAVPDHLPPDAQGRQGIVLVHGWLCNRAVWTDVMRDLRALDVPFIAVSLPLLLHRIEDARPMLDSAARRLCSATGLPALMMAHSMGGLVVRDWLRGLDGGDPQAAHLPRDVVTVASPHRGSPLAHCMWGANVRQMLPAGEWLGRLRADEAREGSAFSRVRWHCVFSDCDNVVFPEANCVLDAAQVFPLAGYAHMQMLRAPKLHALVSSLLGRAQ